MRQLEEATVKKFEEICGSNYVITDKSQMMRYKKDETKALEEKVDLKFPEVVLKPDTTQQVSDIMKLATREKIPITPRGGGTGESGGAVPVKGGVVLSLERMDEVVEMDKEDLYVTVEAGMTLEKLYGVVEGVGLYFPPHPGDEGAFVGGCAATNAAGARCVRYGPVRNYIKGLEVVLPNGQALDLGGKLLKNNTGYALRHLLIGSEGTLGIITKVTLRLMPASFEPEILIIPYENRGDAIGTVPQVIRSGILPLGVEYMSREAIDLSEEYLDRKWPTEKGKCTLMFLITGENEDVILSKSQKVMEIAQENNALDVFMAEQMREKENIWEIRSTMGEAMKEHGVMETFDITVPPSKVGELMRRSEAISEKYDVRLPGLGHAADGNVHLELFKTDMETYKKVKQKLLEAGRELGGVVTGEHGVGFTKREDLHYSRSPTEIELMRKIKEVFDPHDIMNPEKVVPSETLE